MMALHACDTSCNTIDVAASLDTLKARLALHTTTRALVAMWDVSDRIDRSRVPPSTRGRARDALEASRVNAVVDSRALSSSRSLRNQNSFPLDDDDDELLALQRREKLERSKTLREALERQIEEKRERREGEVVARASRAARAKADALAMKRSSELEAMLRGLSERFEETTVRVDEAWVHAPRAVQDDASEEDVFEEESTFIRLSDDETWESEETRLVAQSPLETPKKAASAVLKSPPKPNTPPAADADDDDDKHLFRRGSVKAFVKLWDTPRKASRP